MVFYDRESQWTIRFRQYIEKHSSVKDMDIITHKTHGDGREIYDMMQEDIGALGRQVTQENAKSPIAAVAVLEIPVELMNQSHTANQLPLDSLLYRAPRIEALINELKETLSDVEGIRVGALSHQDLTNRNCRKNSEGAPEVDIEGRIYYYLTLSAPNPQVMDAALKKLENQLGQQQDVIPRPNF